MMRLAAIRSGRSLVRATWFLAVVLSLATHSSGSAASTPGAAEPLDLQGGPVPVSVSVPGESAWFRISPPVSMEFTHFEIGTAGSTDTVLEIFASLEEAK